MIKGFWWKIGGILLLLYAVIAGFIGDVPDMPNIRESIRNLYFHVGMWLSMIVLMAISVVYSIKYLKGFELEDDTRAAVAVNTGLFFGMLGLLTGMIWAKYTWGSWWVNDPKLNGAAVGLLAYFAYIILRNSFDNDEKKARVSAVYNIFAFVLLIVFLIILPRTAEYSIHPGKQANPVLPMYLDAGMRLVFYPAMLGWVLLALWIFNLTVRIKKIKDFIDEKF